MTSFKARLAGKIPTTNNKKDGATGRRRRNDNEDAQFEALGFEMADWNKWSYTWPGNFPIIKLVPGIVDFTSDWVAIYKDRQIPLGKATPAEIKDRLDDEILSIMRYEAELAEAQIELEIGPEIDIDLWMTQPQTALRRSTPAIRRLGRRYGVSLEEADEIALMRGE